MIEISACSVDVDLFNSAYQNTVKKVSRDYITPALSTYIFKPLNISELSIPKRAQLFFNNARKIRGYSSSCSPKESNTAESEY